MATQLSAVELGGYCLGFEVQLVLLSITSVLNTLVIEIDRKIWLSTLVPCILVNCVYLGLRF